MGQGPEDSLEDDQRPRRDGRDRGSLQGRLWQTPLPAAGDGFYEWRKVGKNKQPYALGMADGEPFTLAGLWENWKDPDSGEWVRTFTIVTTEANELVAVLHDRMPVIIAPEDRDRWLSDPDPSDLLKPYSADLMTMWPVTRDVNSPKNDRPDLPELVEDPEPWPERDGDVESANSPDADRRPANSA